MLYNCQPQNTNGTEPLTIRNMCQWSLTYNESDILQTRDILLRHMIYHILMLNCEFESPHKTSWHPCGKYSFLVIMWGFFCLFFIPLLKVFCKLYVHKDNSSWQIITWVNSVYVFYSNTLSKISLATCINNWVILHLWTYFFKRLEKHIPLTNTFMYIVYIVLVI